MRKNAKIKYIKKLRDFSYRNVLHNNVIFYLNEKSYIYYIDMNYKDNIHIFKKYRYDCKIKSIVL